MGSSAPLHSKISQNLALNTRQTLTFRLVFQVHNIFLDLTTIMKKLINIQLDLIAHLR